LDKDLLGFGVLILLASVLVYFGLTQSGGAEFSLSPQDINLNWDFPDIPFDPPEDEDPSMWVRIRFEPNPVCVGDPVTGTLSSNMPGAFCRIWYQITGEEPQKFADVALDSDGEWSRTEVLGSTGHVDFKAVCVYGDSWAQSDTIGLDVITCGDDSDDTDGGSEGEDGPYQGMPCETVPPGEETCVQGACNEGVCVYVPGDLMNPDQCLCDIS